MLATYPAFLRADSTSSIWSVSTIGPCRVSEKGLSIPSNTGWLLSSSRSRGNTSPVSGCDQTTPLSLGILSSTFSKKNVLPEVDEFLSYQSQNLGLGIVSPLVV